MTDVFDHPFLGGLFADQDAAALWAPDQQIAHMLAFEAALTRAKGTVGTVSVVAADHAAAQIEAFEPDLDGLRKGMARDGVIVPELVAQLKAGIATETGVVHSGATSQDVIDTALAMTLKGFNDLLVQRLDTLVNGLNDLNIQFGDRPIMGRTRMQAALPITVNDRLCDWIVPIVKHQDTLVRLRSSVESVQLGGPVGNRASLAPHGDQIAHDIAERLGLSNPPKAWHSTRENIAEYASLLSMISGSIGKIGQDICLMAQQGVDEIRIQGGGSSAMPHKQNPILAELLVTLARFNATQLAGIHHGLVHEQERSGAAWALEWMILPQMAIATARSLSAAVEICAGVNTLGQGDEP